MSIFPELWDASFRGVPFHVEKEASIGGRRLAVHEFPFRDDPFIEDMGAAKREFSVTAYVASESTLGEAAALEAALRLWGAGLLVLPSRGPEMVRVASFDRSMARDALGYLAFEIKFIAEGLGTALVSVVALASRVFAGGGAALDAAASVFSGLQLAGLRGDVTVTAQALAQQSVAMIEAIRLSETVDPAVSATVRDTLATLYADIPALVSRSDGASGAFVTRLGEAARDLAEGMDANRAVSAFAAMADVSVAPAESTSILPASIALAVNAGIIARATRLVCLTAYADSLTRAAFPSRREAITARADASERFAAAIEECGVPQAVDLLPALQALRGAVVEHISQALLDLRPVVTISTQRRLPALYWANRLYGSAASVEDLVSRNGVPHPGYMPLQFEALAP